MTIYLARQNADLTEGRGPMCPKIGFTLRIFAERYIETRDRSFWDIKEIEVLDHVPDHKMELRVAALKKLTAEEIAALGLGSIEPQRGD